MAINNVTGAQSIIKAGVCTSSTRPASPYDGQMIYETDTDRALVWDGSAWSVFIGASSLSGTIASFNQERSGSVTTGQKYANGNGSADTYICFPADCKLVAATISAGTDINGTAVIRPWLNAAVLAVSTYDITVSVASPVVSYNFYSSPLSIPANQRFAWNCQSSTVTVGTTSITFYVRFD